MAKELLIDTMTIKLSLEEGKEGAPGKLIARGEFARSGVPTANRRIYPESLWKREIGKLTESIAGRKVFGELDHPADGKTKLSRASHIITGLQVEQDGVVTGAFEVMNTRAGQDLKAILDANGSIGVSSRGYGSVVKNESGYDVVQEDYQLMTFDAVADPANSTSYPKFAYEQSKDGVNAMDIKQEQEAPKAPVVAEAKPEAAANLKEAAAANGLEVKAATPVAAPLSEEVISKAAHEKQIAEMKESFSNQLIVEMKSVEERLREEITAQVSTDPKVVGAMMALAGVKNALRPYVMPEDVESELSIRENKIKEQAEKIAALEAKVADSEQVVAQLEAVAQDVGYNLYLERVLRGHPKFKEIVEGLGDLTMISSIKELQNKVATHVSELPAILKRIKDNESAEKARLESRIKELEAQLVESKKITEQAEKDKDAAIEVGLSSATRAYLERKIVGNPNASAIRMKFESMTQKTKESVDNLIESFAQSRGSSDFERVRNRLRGNKDAQAPTGLVENSVKGTLTEAKGRGELRVTHDYAQPIEQIMKLSGVTKK